MIAMMRQLILPVLFTLTLPPSLALAQDDKKPREGLLAPESVVVGEADDEKCHPPIDPSKPQDIVGYGSLMQTGSKRGTEPDAGKNLPVRVVGFQRAWNTHGVFPTCYLGVQQSKSARMVAALYRSFPIDGVLTADAREIDYCRVAVDPDAVTMLDGSPVPADSQIWVYVNKPETLAVPDAGHPIVQSYVDIVITGCLELQKLVKEPDVDFVEQFVKTTKGWSKHWVNDRLYPRRPYIHQPKAWEIDSALKKHLPELYKNIRIE